MIPIAAMHDAVAFQMLDNEDELLPERILVEAIERRELELANAREEIEPELLDRINRVSVVLEGLLREVGGVDRHIAARPQIEALNHSLQQLTTFRQKIYLALNVTSQQIEEQKKCSALLGSQIVNLRETINKKSKNDNLHQFFEKGGTILCKRVANSK